MSTQTILIAHTHTHTHTHTHAHRGTHTHKADKHTDYTKLNLHNIKWAVNRLDTEVVDSIH